MIIFTSLMNASPSGFSEAHGGKSAPPVIPVTAAIRRSP
jgi:hypothetical protein